MGKVFKDDIGTKISLDTGIDITDSTDREIHYKKPSGSAGQWAAEKGTGEDKNTIFYITQKDDIDECGIWILQSFVKFTNGEWRGEKVEMEVGNILLKEEET